MRRTLAIPSSEWRVLVGPGGTHLDLDTDTNT
jgi:hypothetical protein